MKKCPRVGRGKGTKLHLTLRLILFTSSFVLWQLHELTWFLFFSFFFFAVREPLNESLLWRIKPQILHLSIYLKQMRQPFQLRPPTLYCLQQSALLPSPLQVNTLNYPRRRLMPNHVCMVHLPLWTCLIVFLHGKRDFLFSYIPLSTLISVSGLVSFVLAAEVVALTGKNF